MLAAAKKSPTKIELSNACLSWLYQGTRDIPLIKRLYPSLLKAWARLTWSQGYKVKRFMGVSYLLNYHNQIDRKIGLHGRYEDDVRAYLFSEMEKRGCDVFLDIGASIGVYALEAAHRGLAKEVHAFEPDPRNFAHLAFNVYLNDFTVQPHSVALSSTSGTVQFEMSSDEKTTHSQVVSAAQTAPAMGRDVLGAGKRCEVKAQALDDILPYQGKKIFLKINVQGHETDVLKGAARFLRENDCFFQIWLWPENRDRVIQQLAGMGYKVIHANQGSHYSDQGYFYLAR